MHDALASALDGLIASHEELMTIAAEKQQVIIRNDIAALNGFVQREGRLLRAIASQEQERERCARELFVRLGIPHSEPASLSTIIRYSTGAEAKLSLSRRREKLQSLLNSLREQNERNQQLIEHALRYVNYSLDLFSYSPMDDVTYRPPGQGYGKSGSGMFNARA